jgi:beta-lactamase class A
VVELTRRQVLVGAAVLAGAAAVYREPAAFADPATDARFAALEGKYTARVGVFAVNLDSQRVVGYRDGERFAMCSTFKTYASARVLQMVQRGELEMDQNVFVDPAAIVANSPVTQPRAGGEMTLAELCQAALQVSDNTAGNLLLKTIGGPQAITSFALSIGDDQTRLDRWETELNSAIPGDPRDTSTPRGLATGYRNLLTGHALAPPQRQQLEDWMRGNQTSSMRAGLPPGWTSADKTGSGDYGSTNDVGVAYGPQGQRVLLSMMTRSQAEDPKAENLRPLIGELTTVVLPGLAIGT